MIISHNVSTKIDEVITNNDHMVSDNAATFHEKMTKLKTYRSLKTMREKNLQIS